MYESRRILKALGFMLVGVVIWGLCVTSTARALPAPEPGVRVTWGSTADADSAMAMRLNPASLAFLPSWSLIYLHSGPRFPWNGGEPPDGSQGQLGVAGDGEALLMGFRPMSPFGGLLGIRIASGLAFQYLYASPKDASGEFLGSHFRFSYALATRMGKWFALGFNYHLLLGDNAALQSLQTTDLSLLLRPSNWLSLAIVGRDLISSSFGDEVIPMTLEFGVALRPVLNDRWVLSADVILRDETPAQFRYRMQAEPISGLVVGANFTHDINFNGFSVGAFLEFRFQNWSLGGLGLIDLQQGGQSQTALRHAEVALRVEGAAQRPLIRTRGRMPLVDIGGSLPERDRSLSANAGRPIFLNLIMALDRIARDEDVSAVLLRIGALRCGMAKVQELRAALMRIKKSGKKLVVYMATSELKSYYLASLADQIWLHPAGSVWLRGLAVNHLFYAKALSKIGVKAQFVKIGKYKTAPNQYTKNDLVPAQREASKALLDDLYGQLVSDIAKARKQKRGKIREWIKLGLYPAKLAQKAGIVDDVFYWSQIDGKIRERMGRLYRFDPGYLSRTFVPSRWRGYDRVAVIQVDGTIVTGGSLDDPLFGMHLSGSSTLVRLLQRARFDRRVRAVVLRVDSPGGSVLASDLIWRAVAQLNRVKPVVVSMGDVAASGGYYVSAPAREVFASRATITGSIGIFAGKFDFSGLLQMLGVTHRVQKRGGTADLFSPYRPFSPAQRKRMQMYIRTSYDAFLQKVSKGRKLPMSQLRKVALGRVWSGERAKQKGLIDRVGGLWDAIRRAKELAGLSPDAKLEIQAWPKRSQLNLSSLRLPSLSAQGAFPAKAKKSPRHVVQLLQGWRRVVRSSTQPKLWAIYTDAVE